MADPADTTVEDNMAIIPEMLSGLMTVVIVSCMVAALVKAVQIANDLGEMKELLRDIKRNTSDGLRPAPEPVEQQSAESLMRAVHGDAYSETSRDL